MEAVEVETFNAVDTFETVEFSEFYVTQQLMEHRWFMWLGECQRQIGLVGVDSFYGLQVLNNSLWVVFKNWFDNSS